MNAISNYVFENSDLPLVDLTHWLTPVVRRFKCNINILK